MTQQQRLEFLIHALIQERTDRAKTAIPTEPAEQQRLLRTLLNLRPPAPASAQLLETQDAYLQEELRRKGITRLPELTPVAGQLYLWRGDITTLQADGIVNAANSQMLGCFHPCHGCIDNAIHTYAGLQLRLACAELMGRQGCKEPVGCAKITPAFNLPSKYVLHTVGPVVNGQLTYGHCAQLASCYRSCLKLAQEHGLSSLAFCCISTGEFRFPNRQAAEIAVGTVTEYIRDSKSDIEVVFNVFKKEDYGIYQQLLQADSQTSQ